MNYFNSPRYRKFIFRGLIAFLVVALLVVSVFIIKYECKSSSIEYISEDSEELTLPKEDYGHKYIKVNMKEKKRISKGKFGFRKRVEFSSKAGVNLALHGSLLENIKDIKCVRFGIYRDKDLEDPIEEIKFTDYGESYLEAEWGWKRKIPENKDGIITLEPGNYYLGLYTTNPYDEFSLEYSSWYEEVKEDYIINKGMDTEVFLSNPDQIAYVKFTAQKLGMDKMQICSEVYVQLCDENKKTISEKQYMDVNVNNCIFEFKAEKNKTYYIRLFNKDTEFELFPVVIEYPVERK